MYVLSSRRRPYFAKVRFQLYTVWPTHVANLPSHMGQVMVGGPQDRSRLCGSLLVREASRGLA